MENTNYINQKLGFFKLKFRKVSFSEEKEIKKIKKLSN